MNSNTLSLLGCTSVLVVALATASAADAATVKKQPVTIANIKTQTVKTAGASHSKVNYRAVALDPMSDTVGDAAVAKFQCDCPPCRMAIVQMVQAGQLTL
jgi:hypothetical protein